MFNRESLLAAFPDNVAVIDRLADILGGGQAIPLNRLFNKVFTGDGCAPIPVLALANILNHCVDVGAMQKIVRVSSPGLGGLADFSSISDVPDVIFDWRRGVDMFVLLENIDILYQEACSTITDQRLTHES